MGLLESKRIEESQNYINILKAIDMISFFTKDNTQEVAKYLLGKKAHNYLATYCLDDIGSYELLDEYPIDTCCILMKILEIKNYDSDLMLNPFNYPELLDYEDLCWMKSKFLEFQPIVEIGINSHTVRHFFKHTHTYNNKKEFSPFTDFPRQHTMATKISKAPPPIKPLNGSSYFSPKVKTNNNVIEKLQEENENLKIELAQAQARIKELEKEQSIKHPSLDSSHPKHAPELLLAVQAWEAKYLRNKYPHHQHSPAIEAYLRHHGHTTQRLIDRISAVTNPKELK